MTGVCLCVCVCEAISCCLTPLTAGVCSPLRPSCPHPLTSLSPSAAPEARLVKVLEQCAAEAQASINASASAVAAAAGGAGAGVSSSSSSRTPVDEGKVATAIANCKGAVMMAYPMGLPEFDTVQQALDDKEVLEGTQQARDWFDPASCSVWFSGKKVPRADDVDLGRVVGRNDKVTIKVKLTSERVANAPQREPQMDAETQRSMMQLWHKKQEEARRLAEAGVDEDSYLNSAWANPQGFKQSANGLGSVRYR